VNYTDSGESLVQIWDVRGPQFIKEDWRPGDRFRSTLTILPSKYNSTEKMLFNVALITPFAKQMVGWANMRLQVKGELKPGEGEGGAKWTEDGKSDWNRPTTEGVSVCACGGDVATQASAWRVIQPR
jgi:hypothetical protein